MTLDDLAPGHSGTVAFVKDALQPDPIARRIRELGFVAGEDVRVVTTGPFGRDPILVEVGYTRFALRREEAARVHLEGAL